MSIFTPKTSFTRSSLVWTFLGVNSASWAMEATLPAKGRSGKLSTRTSASWPIETRPRSASLT